MIIKCLQRVLCLYPYWRYHDVNRWNAWKQHFHSSITHLALGFDESRIFLEINNLVIVIPAFLMHNAMMIERLTSNHITYCNLRSVGQSLNGLLKSSCAYFRNVQATWLQPFVWYKHGFLTLLLFSGYSQQNENISCYGVRNWGRTFWQYCKYNWELILGCLGVISSLEWNSWHNPVPSENVVKSFLSFCVKLTT